METGRGRHRRGRSAARCLGMVLLAGAVAAGCSRNPATGEREISLVSEGQEIQMGQEAHPQILAQLGAYDDPELQAYVARIGAELAGVAERPNLPWTFTIIDDPTPNAFALPGGFVYITRGLMSHLRSEAELAGVLAHEVAHITARHSVQQISQQQLTQLGVGIGMILVPELQNFGGLANAGMQLLFLKYSRDDENKADELGIRYMTRMDYNPLELADVMRTLERTAGLNQNSGRVPEFLSTHPEPGNRADRIAELVEAGQFATGTMTVAREPYLRALDGMVFGPDPREGYFEGTTFLHPELRFRLDFPSGWRTANMKQAVQAMSSAEDALMVLTLAEGAPGSAIRSFANSQGVQVGQPRSTTMNGLDAAIAEFAARTEQGTLQGLVMFVTLGDNTYRILGYGPQQRWSANARAVEASMGSFAPVTDPAVLNAQPDRLDLVTLDREQAFSTFMERYPSAVEPELLAIINHVSTNSRLPAGFMAKRVVAGR